MTDEQEKVPQEGDDVLRYDPTNDDLVDVVVAEFRSKSTDGFEIEDDEGVIFKVRWSDSEGSWLDIAAPEVEPEEDDEDEDDDF